MRANTMELKTNLYLGDCLEVLKELPDNCVDLIFTSPPYADQRKNTYGGIHTDDYVAWFLPRSEQFLRVLKPSGTFVLNIKEKVANGERSIYVLELILEMRKQGWFWTEEFIWHKKNSYPGNGPTDSGMHGSDYYSSTRTKNFLCIRNPLWYPWGIGQSRDCEN
jgi:site-specific DNA-methyltransferase (adenine-specific)